MESVGKILGYCRHGDARLSRVLSTTGKDRVCVWCVDCRHIVSKEKGYLGVWIAHDHPDVVAAGGVALLEVAYTDRIWRKCEGPHDAMALCELHHIAPTSIFGEESERWPTFWLCRPCHERWHRIMTPGLCTTYDPEVHVRMLQAYLSDDQLTALLVALNRAAQEAA